ncbi:MAG: hypothetical protein ACM3XP_05225 [Nitrososphaerales archaeon]
MSAFTVRAGGERQYIYGKKFEDYGKAKIKFYLDGIDNRVYALPMKDMILIHVTFKTYLDEPSVNFYVD